MLACAGMTELKRLWYHFASGGRRICHSSVPGNKNYAIIRSSQLAGFVTIFLKEFMMKRPIHFEILADDPARVGAFYQAVLDWEIARPGGEAEPSYWVVTTG